MMKPNSLSPCADWFRFIKSISIELQGISALNCVCKWQIGLFKMLKPLIHILAGEKVCIQVMIPIQFLVAFASWQTLVISSGVFTVGLKTIFTGMCEDEFNPFTISCELAAT